MNKLSKSFYVRYMWNNTKKDRVRKAIVTLVSAGAVAFTAMSFGYLSGYSADLDAYMESVSELELTVVNKTNPISGVYSERGDLLTEEEIEKICNMEDIQTAVPCLTFGRNNDFYSFEVDLSNDEELAAVYHKCNVNFENANGNLPVPNGSATYDGPYSYSTQDVMDSKCTFVDNETENGAYLSASFASTYGISREDLEGLKVTLDLWIPTGILNTYSMGMSTEEGETGDSFMVNVYVTKKATVTVPVRGILASNPQDPNSRVFLPADIMLTEQKKADDGLKLANQILDVEKKSLEGDPDSPWVQNPTTVKEWGPCLYYVVAKDITVVQKVKEELEAINPNFEVISVYQDIDAGTQIISNNRNVMLYISFAVLAVALLLMALIYVSLIDRRKFEFAVLRANGFTKCEVRKLIYVEMFWQFLKIFLFGIIAAAAIYFIGKVWLGYPFQFDGMTVLWLFVISLGSVILPTIISLLFVNKFEPDQVMRN